MYPSNDTDVNEFWSVKYSVPDRGIDIQGRTASTFGTNTGPSFKSHDAFVSLQ